MYFRSVLLASLGILSGCTSASAPPTPKESPFCSAVDLRASVETTAPKDLAWHEVSHGGSGTASPGRGQWNETRVFLLHGDVTSIDALLSALHNELIGTARRSGADVEDEEAPSGESDHRAFEFRYSSNNHKGKVVARIEQPPDNAHILDGREATHQLTIELTETFQTGP